MQQHIEPLPNHMLSGLQACRAAHADLRPAALSWSQGDLLDANINRSPTAYANNPAAERALYKHDVDKDMTVLKIHTADGKGRCVEGLLWAFAGCSRAAQRT
jgi:neutral ceramidase